LSSDEQNNSDRGVPDNIRNNTDSGVSNDIGNNSDRGVPDDIRNNTDSGTSDDIRNNTDSGVSNDIGNNSDSGVSDDIRNNFDRGVSDDIRNNTDSGVSNDIGNNSDRGVLDDIRNNTNRGTSDGIRNDFDRGASNDRQRGSGSGLLTAILGVLCVFFAAAAVAFAFYYFKTLKELEQKNKELRQRTGDRDKEIGRGYYDLPASEASGLLNLSSSQRQLSGRPTGAGSLQNNDKNPYPWKSYSDLPPASAYEKRGTPSPAHAPQEAFSYKSLFFSNEERSNFSTEGLVYLAISEKTMQQIAEGDKNCPIYFDKKQSRIYAEYILVKNRFLLPNYYIYNETKGMPDLMAIKCVFSIQGRLPGKITDCSPAQVKLAGDKYELIDKGILTVQ
jgi:hypothetical protein